METHSRTVRSQRALTCSSGRRRLEALTYVRFSHQLHLTLSLTLSPDASATQSFLGAEDRRFLSKQSFDDRLPAAQASGRALCLQRAVEMGDVRLLLAQLKAHSVGLVHQRNCHGETLLHTAVLHNQLLVVQTLLQHGASPNAELPSHQSSSQLTLESVAPRSDNFRYSRVLSAAEATPVHYGTQPQTMNSPHSSLAKDDHRTPPPPSLD